MRRFSLNLLILGCVLNCLPAFGQHVSAKICCLDDYYRVEVNPVANKIYVIDEVDRELGIVDGATNQMVTVATGRGARNAAFNTTTNKIYVPNSQDNTVTVVNGTTLATQTVQVGSVPAAAAVNPNTNKIYVANADSNNVTVIDGTTLATHTIAVDEGPVAIAVNPTINKIYVGNQRYLSHSSITVIDGTTEQTTTVTMLDPGYLYGNTDSLIVNPATNQVYALGEIYLNVLDGATNTMSGVEWPDFGCITAMALNPATMHLYAPDSCGSQVVDYDISSGTSNTLPVDWDPEYVSVDSNRNRLYLYEPYTYELAVLDLVQHSETNFNYPVESFNLATNSSTNTTYFGAYDGLYVLSGATPMQFVALQPCRVVDTRQTGSPIMGDSWANFDVLGAGCGVPASAAAYSMNVTVVPVDPSLSYITLWPTDQVRPTISTMNSLDGRIKADAAIVPAGTLGYVSIFASNTTNAIIDINGYFKAADSSTLAFYPMTPCRVVDTRDADGPLGGPYLSGAVERDFPVPQSPCIPAGTNIAAYSFNVTAVPHVQYQPLGYLTMWPKGSSRPTVSTLNNPTGTIVANAAIVPVGEDGEVAAFPDSDTDLVIDINGYFAAPGSGGLSLYATPPCRVLDTRQGNGAFSGELDVNVGCATNGAQAYVFNATVVPQGSLGYLTLWPNGQDRPVASTLNAIDGAITSNMAIVQSSNGSIDAYASGLTQLILDISSYFAP